MNVSLNLSMAACLLAQEIWDQKWAHIARLKNKPVGECVEIIDELKRRCPGHTIEEYKEAIAKGMYDQR